MKCVNVPIGTPDTLHCVLYKFLSTNAMIKDYSVYYYNLSDLLEGVCLFNLAKIFSVIH